MVQVNVTNFPNMVDYDLTSLKTVIVWDSNLEIMNTTLLTGLEILELENVPLTQLLIVNETNNIIELTLSNTSLSAFSNFKLEDLTTLKL